MADDIEDPREVAWHPRLAEQALGHDTAKAEFIASFSSGRPHHAWLITGPLGIGKATLAYEMARHVLATGTNAAQTQRWVHARSHPDLCVLERSFTETKPKKLKSEIAVDDVRNFNDFFARTSSGGGWRIGLVDCADDLNSESANALLKLVEEPPTKSLILLTCHSPGKVLRTLRSRCRKLPLAPLPAQTTLDVLTALPLNPAVSVSDLSAVAQISEGRPGLALQLLQNDGAKAFQLFAASKRLDATQRNAIGQYFATRASAPQNYDVFVGLLLDWLAQRAKVVQNAKLAELHASLCSQQAIVNGYNLDRRVAVMESLNLIDHALKTA